MSDGKNFRKNKPPSQSPHPERDIEFDFETGPEPGHYRPLRVEAEHGLDSDSGFRSSTEEPRRADGVRRIEPPRKTSRPENEVRTSPPDGSYKPSNPSETMPTSMPTIQPTISDFRKNADRQRREQKSTNKLLSGVAYFFIGGLLLVAILAGFGGYVLWQQIESNSVTVAQLNAKVDQQDTALLAQIDLLKNELSNQSAAAQAQQQNLNKLASLQDKIQDKLSAAIREEKSDRARELVKIIKRIQRVEDRSVAR